MTSAQIQASAVLQEFLALQVRREALTLPTSLSDFIKATWPILEPGKPFDWNWHIDCMSEYLTAVRLGQIQDLIINMPPRNLKSNVVTVNTPCHWWASDPTERFLFTSYDDNLVKKHSVDRRTLIESDWYQQRWGALAPAPLEGQIDKRIIIASDQNEKKFFMNTQRGFMLSASVGSGMTGKGGGVLIIDDPQDPEDLESDTKAQIAIRYIENTLMSRLDDKRTGRKIIVMQRLGERDVTAHEYAKGNYVLLMLPAEFHERTFVEFPLSKKTVVKEAGDVLNPVREPQAVLDKLKIGMTLQRFNAQYNQRCAPAEGNILQRAWWKFYGGNTGNVRPHDDEFDMIVDSWDMTFKKKSKGEQNKVDYCVGGKWGIRGSSLYLLRLIRRRMSFTEARDAILDLSITKPYPSSVLIEESANGPAVIDSLQDVIAGIDAINATKDKLERANAASPVLKAGNIYLPLPSTVDDETAKQLYECLEEAAVFNKGEHDDFVDMWSQTVNWFVKHGGGMLAWVEKRERELKAAAAAQRQTFDKLIVVHDDEKQPPNASTSENAMRFADLMPQ